MARAIELKVFLAGRVAVETDGVVIDEPRFPGRQGRLLFAYLVAEQGRPVPRDELADALWGPTPPATWEKALTVIVSKLRGLLADGGMDGGSVITSAFGCYRLDLPEGSWVDVIAAAGAADEAAAALAAGELEKAKIAAGKAASLLRHPFLPGEDGTWVEEKRRELAEVRDRALGALADASLRSGDPSEAVKWAERTVALAPFRETGYRRLMEAHAAAGNRAEALRVYEQCRRLLADELGAYPSPETESIFRSLLTAPAAPPRPPAAVETPPHEAEPVAPHERGKGLRTGGRRGLVAAAAVAALAAGGAAVFALLSVHGSHATRVASNSVGIVDPGSGRLRADVAVGATPTHAAVGEGAYWITNADADTVSRIDAATNAVVQTIPVGSSPSGITTGNGAVWVANSLDGTVSRIDPATNTVVQTIDVGNGPLGIAYAAGSVWVADSGDGTITRIEAGSGRRAETLPVAATDLAVGAGSLWASERAANRVARIDLSSGDVQLIGVGGGPTGIAFGSGAAWVANSLDGTVSRIDPRTNSVAATIPAVGDGPSDVAVQGHGIWVSNQFDGTLARIDARRDSVAQRIRVGDRLQGVAATAGNVLVSVDAQAGAGHRGGTLTVRMNRSLDSIDPAVAYDTTSIPILRMTNDGLVAFNQASGLAGTQLVPDLAVSLPTPTDGGRTYTFRLRSNIRYSNGRSLKASDVRNAFERDFEIGELPVQYYDAIVGADRCVRHRRCDLSHGIVTDDSANTVTFHLVAPDPDFLDQLALEFAYAVPNGAPRKEAQRRPLPATGPYMIASYRPKHVLTLVRNPYFHEWSKAAQPDGYPDTIAFRIGGTPDEAVHDVLTGKVDAFSTSQSQNPPSAAILDALTLRHASQLHTNPQQATIALFLNTRLAPFDRLDVRRALNYAADRAAAVRITGGPEVARPTCQILPPHFPGYLPYCPYTARASTGVWSAPDLAKARALVARSGTRGMKITVWSWGDLAGVGPYTVKLLQSLGYRVSMKTFDANYFEVAFDSRSKAQIGTAEWITDYPTAAGFFNAVFTCASFEPRSPNNVNGSEFCNPRLDHQISHAVAEQTTNPDAARRLWAQIDRSTVDEAPWVPLVNPNVVDVLSKRVGNYQYSPAGWGMLIDQLWVR